MSGGDGWTDSPIGALGTVITGSTPSSKYAVAWGDRYPFITPSDLSYDTPLVATKRALSEEGAIRLKSRLLPPRAVCFTCIGATIGKVCMSSRPSLTNQQINSVVVDERVATPSFLFYKLRVEAARIRGMAGGAATPIINKTAFSDIRLAMPPLDTQRKIAAVLSAYDDLIANNTRRIEILEEMARAIYREWFVEFRFPGHEQVGMVESELGPTPEGWEVKPLSSGASFRRHNISVKSLADLNVAHYSFDAHDGDRLPDVVDGSELRSGKLVLEDDPVLLAKLNPRIHRAWLTRLSEDTASVASGEFLVLHPEGFWTREYLFGLVDSPEFQARFRGLASGTSTSHQRVKPDDAMGMKVVHPPRDQVTRFAGLVQPILTLGHILRRQSKTLRLGRDLILPKLVSGEVDVSDLDIDIGGVAA